MNHSAVRGFTLVELLVVVVMLAVLGAIATPLLSSGDPQTLEVAVEETANTLRFAFSEARRTGGYVLVDGKSTPGQLKLYFSDASAQVPPAAGTDVVNDPLTKRPAVLDVSHIAFSQGVALTPQFRAGGDVRPQLLIGPGLAQLQGFDGPGAGNGLLQANSGVSLQFAQHAAMIRIDHITGLVAYP